MRTTVVVLCEDLQAGVFIRRTLLSLGVHARNIRIRPYAATATHDYEVHPCGSQHVIESYPKELAALRSGPNQATRGLVVHIDVDNTTPTGRTVRERARALTLSCTAQGVAHRTHKEAAALLIARRNIETWIHHLTSGQAVQEHVEYPKLTGRESDAWEAADAFAAHVKTNAVPAHAPHSLAVAVTEMQRLR